MHAVPMLQHQCVANLNNTASVSKIQTFTERFDSFTTSALLKMGGYYNTTLCHYWDMSVK